MKNELNISDILDYANKSDVILDKPTYTELPEQYRQPLMEHRINEPSVEDWGFYDENGELFFVGGHQPVNKYTTEIWSVAFDNSYRKTILKLCRMFCDVWITEFKRLQSLINENNEKAIEFNKLLGLKKEAYIEDFTEDSWYLMRRIKDGS